MEYLTDGLPQRAKKTDALGRRLTSVLHGGILSQAALAVKRIRHERVGHRDLQRLVWLKVTAYNADSVRRAIATSA
jgi:hypothetical protein